MNHKKSAFDHNSIGAVIGVIIFIGIPILFFIWSTSHTNTPTTNTPVNQEYEQWKSEQRADQPTDVNGDGTITRDEADGSIYDVRQ